MDRDQQQDPSSLRFLQLQDAFRRMVVLGAQNISRNEFCAAMEGVPEFYLDPLWRLYGMVTTGLISNCTAEFDDVVREADVAKELEDLEGLLLQRGRPLEAMGASSEAAAAAEDAARLAAKRHELQQLREALAQVKQDTQQAQRQLDVQQRRAAEDRGAYQKLERHMAQVYDCSKQWMTKDVGKA